MLTANSVTLYSVANYIKNAYQREKTPLKWKYDQFYTINIYVNHTVLHNFSYRFLLFLLMIENIYYTVSVI